MVISREFVEALAQVEESHRDSPAHRKGDGPWTAGHACRMKLEREVNALRRELRGE